MYLVQLRHNKGSLQNISIDQHSTVQQLKQYIAYIINAELNSFEIFLRGRIIDDSLGKETLEKLGINENSIIDVTDKRGDLSEVNLVIEYGSQSTILQVTKQEILWNVKTRIGHIFHCHPSTFNVLHRDQILCQQNKTIGDYNIQNGEIIRIILKLPMEYGLGNKLRLIESNGSSSGEVEQRNLQYSPCDRKKPLQLHKAISCSGSLQNIKQSQDHLNIGMKTSSIQLYTMHKNQLNELAEKQNKLTRIEDIKQSMSFGSLEQAKSEELEVQIYNEDSTKYYRITCPYGTKVSQLRQILAKTQRTKVQNIQLIEAGNIDLVQMLNQNEDSIHLTYRFLNI